MGVAAVLQRLILDEMARTFGAAPEGFVRRVLASIAALPTGRFGRLFSAADREVAAGGVGAGCGRLLADIGVHVAARGVENLPARGPLLVASNHPGATDSLALASSMRRGDLMILLREIPFFRALPNASVRFLYATHEPRGSMLALRATIRHLQEGGAVLMFGTGKIEPDPELQAGAVAALARWSRSIEIILRRVRDLRLVLAAASGVMSRAFLYNPLRLLRRDPVDRRRIVEYLQVITQMLLPRLFDLTVKLSFAPPVTADELDLEGGGSGLMTALLDRERRLLAAHQAAWYG